MTTTAVVHRLNIVILLLLLSLLFMAGPMLPELAFGLAFGLFSALILAILRTLASDSVRRSNA